MIIMSNINNKLLGLHRFTKNFNLSLVGKRFAGHLAADKTTDGTENNSEGSLREEVTALYKNLIYLSREWPTDLRPQIKRAFMKNKDVTSAEDIRSLIAKGEYICREITATYHLRKYRAMKRRYYSDDDENKNLQEIIKSFSSQ